MFVRGIDEIWAADLVEMQEFAKDNDGYRYILTVIDVFSKYGWMKPLKNKTGVEVADALSNIFKSSGRKPAKIWCDKGKEFYNKSVDKLVELYSTENEEKSCVIERWNRTMKERMYKYFTAHNTRRYVDVLDELVSHYNNTVHSSTKMTPVLASNKQNEGLVYLTLYDDVIHSPRNDTKPKFKVGDKVRISRKKGKFEKGFTPNWTEEIFTISTIQYTDPITYKIVDTNNEEIKGTFYTEELQKTTQDTFRIEKVLETKGNKLFVKWLGYPDSFNSWVNKSDVVPLDST